MLIQGGINIAHLKLFEPPGGLQQLGSGIPDTFSPEAQAERRNLMESAWYKSVNDKQYTVIRNRDEVIASFGENGFKHFSRNSDAYLVPPGSNSVTIAQALQAKYGNSLIIDRFSSGKGPTYADIFEERHGFAPIKPIYEEV